MTPVRASLGTFSQRAGAWIVDAVPYVVAPALAARLWGLALAIAAFPIVGIVWTMLPEGRTGATPGKRLLGLRTLDIDSALPIGLGRSAVRWFVKYVVCSLLPVGYLWYWRSPERRTFADLAARTVVVVPLPDQGAAASGPSG